MVLTLLNIVKQTIFIFIFEIEICFHDFFKSPASFSFFHLSKQTLQFLQRIIDKNVHPENGAGIRIHDHETHESPPITTRPGLPPFVHD